MNERTITRRRLLAVGGAASATALLPDFALGAERRTAPAKKSWLERGAYNNRVGERFAMTDDAGRQVALTLVAVSDLTGKNSRGRRLEGRNDAFLLDFQAVSDTRQLGQGTRTFGHDALGRHDLFMTASLGANGKPRYSVLVNRSE